MKCHSTLVCIYYIIYSASRRSRSAPARTVTENTLTKATDGITVGEDEQMPWGVLRSKQTDKQQPPLELTVYEAGDIERSARRRREEIEVSGHLLTTLYYLGIACIFDNV